MVALYSYNPLPRTVHIALIYTAVEDINITPFLPVIEGVFPGLNEWQFLLSPAWLHVKAYAFTAYTIAYDAVQTIKQHKGGRVNTPTYLVEYWLDTAFAIYRVAVEENEAIASINHVWKGFVQVIQLSSTITLIIHSGTIILPNGVLEGLSSQITQCTTELDHESLSVDGFFCYKVR